MIHRPAPSSLLHRRVAIANCDIDLSIDMAPEGVSTSLEAIRLAEALVAARVRCDRRMVRVAPLMPSGRPVAMVQGTAAAMFVTVSHSGGVIGAAVCAATGVGLDIVDPSDVGRALDMWFSPDELALLPDDDGLMRARLWGAKEAAFKAARLDEGFRPRSVEIHHIGPNGYRWSVRGAHGPVCGRGVFMATGMHLVAIAVATDCAAAEARPLSTAEVAACS